MQATSNEQQSAQAASSWQRAAGSGQPVVNSEQQRTAEGLLAVDEAVRVRRWGKAVRCPTPDMSLK